ncbi:hypothetical protein ABPG74_011277 [Tetrahymena malaccensis]
MSQQYKVKYNQAIYKRNQLLILGYLNCLKTSGQDFKISHKSLNFLLESLILFTYFLLEQTVQIKLLRFTFVLVKPSDRQIDSQNMNQVKTRILTNKQIKIIDLLLFTMVDLIFYSSKTQIPIRIKLEKKSTNYLNHIGNQHFWQDFQII